MVPAPRTPGTGNTGSAFVPDASPSLASSDRRLVFICLDNVFFGIGFLLYDCLDHVTDFAMLIWETGTAGDTELLTLDSPLVLLEP